MADASQIYSTTAIPQANQIGQGYDTAKLAYQNTLTKLNQQRQALARQSGYNVQYDPTSGKVTSLGVDGTNTFGGYQQTLRDAALTDRSARFGAEERGLRGGLAHQAEGQARYGNQLNLTNFGTSILGGFDDLAGQQQDATTQYNNYLYEQEQNAARDAIAKQQFNQTNYDGIQYDPYGDNSAPADMGGTGPAYVTEDPGTVGQDTTTTVPPKKGVLPKARTSGLGGAAGMALLNPGKNQVTTKKIVQQAIEAAKPKPKPKKLPAPVYVHSPGLAQPAPKPAHKATPPKKKK